MRGDSLRDFYAKTFAVLGLGLLAGAGAAVDYWPTGTAMPAIAAPARPAPARLVLTQNLDLKIPAPVVKARHTVVIRGTIHAKNVGSAHFLTAKPQPVEVTSSAPAAPESLAAPIESQWEVVTNSPEWIGASLIVLPPPNAAPSPGLIGGALRRTKDSLVKTGAVTGNTIADAVKGVFGAFKKVSPF